MSEIHDPLAFSISQEQQGVLGRALSMSTPTVIRPHEFVQLLGQAQLAHDMYAQSAESQRGKERRADRANAGIAQSVVVGVLNKVAELGNVYDVAVQTPLSAQELPMSEDYAPFEMPAMFTPSLRCHYNMAAARMIDTVREAQKKELIYEDMFKQAS
jgi:hypothetical protein